MIAPLYFEPSGANRLPLFRNSLFAAFEPQEVVAQIEEAGLSGLEVGVVSDRHLAVHGVRR